ncbi:MAG: hypothetical protein JWM47_3787 [Acidimicrobiales bacterium]|nr:hypothetical protein [Acidimicrobiales bacterium]
MSQAYPDPWHVPVRDRRQGAGLGWFLVLAAWAVGCLGPVGRLWPMGEAQRRGSLVVVAVVLFTAVALRAPLGRVARLAVVATLLGVGAGVTHLSVGVTPLVVALAAMAAAGTALGAWSVRRMAPWGLAVPVVVAAGLVWRHQGSLPPTFALLAVALAACAAALRLSVLRRADDGARRSITALVSAVAGAVLFVAVLLVMYVPGAVAVVIRRLLPGPARGASSWSSRRLSPAATRRSAPHLFTTPSRQSVVKQLVGGTVVGALAVGGLVFEIRSRPPEVVREAVDPVGSTPAPDVPITDPATGDPGGGASRYSETLAGKGLPWADEVLDEQVAVPLPPSPVASYGLGDYRTEYTNVVDGERRTLQPGPCDCRPVEVWMTGGSAAFGDGQRDLHTIQSELVRLADASGTSVRVRNIAVPGYSLWQEYQSVLARLASDAPRPDHIIFYDGFNDVLQSFVPAVVGEVDWSAPAVFDPAALRAFRTEPEADMAEALSRQGGPKGLGDKIAERYGDLQRIVRDQLAAMDIDSSFFFQPDATSADRQRRAVERIYALPVLRAEVIDEFTSTVAAVADGLPTFVHDLHDLFDQTTDPVFIDLVHTNEVGARTVAEAIFADVRTLLDDAAR